MAELQRMLPLKVEGSGGRRVALRPGDPLLAGSELPRCPKPPGEYLSFLARRIVLLSDEKVTLWNDPQLHAVEQQLFRLLRQPRPERPFWIPVSETDGLGLGPPPLLRESICETTLARALHSSRLRDLSPESPRSLWFAELRGESHRVSGLMLLLEYVRARNPIASGSQCVSYGEALDREPLSLGEVAACLINAARRRMRDRSTSEYIPEADYFDDRFHPLLRTENSIALMRACRRRNAYYVFPDGRDESSIVNGSLGQPVHFAEVFQAYGERYRIPPELVPLHFTYMGHREPDYYFNLSLTDGRDGHFLRALVEIFRACEASFNGDGSRRLARGSFEQVLVQDSQGGLYFGRDLIKIYQDCLDRQRVEVGINDTLGDPREHDAWVHYLRVRACLVTPPQITAASLKKADLDEPTLAEPAAFEATLHQLVAGCLGGNYGKLTKTALAKMTVGVGALYMIDGMDLLGLYAKSLFREAYPGATADSDTVHRTRGYSPVEVLARFKAANTEPSKERADLSLSTALSQLLRLVED